MGAVDQPGLARFVDLFYVLLVLLLVWLSLHILRSELKHFIEAMKSELLDGLRGKHSVGALNFYGFVCTGSIGLIAIVATTGQKVMGIAFAKLIGEKKAAELVGYTNYQTYFVVMAVILVISVICVVIDNRRK